MRHTFVTLFSFPSRIAMTFPGLIKYYIQDTEVEYIYQIRTTLQYALLMLQPCAQIGSWHRCPVHPESHWQVFGFPLQLPCSQPGNATHLSHIVSPVQPFSHVHVSGSVQVPWIQSWLHLATWGMYTKIHYFHKNESSTYGCHNVFQCTCPCSTCLCLSCNCIQVQCCTLHGHIRVRQCIPRKYFLP